MRKILFSFLVLSLVLALFGCGQTGGQPSSPPAHQDQPAGASTPTTGTLIVEPQAGVAPYLSLVQQAQHSIDVNSYLLTDRDMVSALVQKAQSGATVGVAGDPYGDQKAVVHERAAFAGIPVPF